jgi:outer membrane protein OmpA-like peptidoglycan-associated protein
MGVTNEKSAVEAVTRRALGDRDVCSDPRAAVVRAMKTSVRVHLIATAAAQLLVLLYSHGVPAAEPPPTVIDSNTIIRSLTPPSSNVAKRGLQVESSSGGESDTGNGGKITLDIRFGNDSNQLNQATEGQLEALGSALASPELARARFLIAGHTSNTGTPEHNRKLSDARAQAVRTYLINRFHLAPDRIAATGYGSSRPLPNFAPNSLQQRRVEVIRLAANSADRSSR